MDRKSGLLYISIAVMLVVVIILGVILTLDRDEPTIYVQTEVNQKNIYWNLQTPIKVEVSDKSKLKSFQAILIDNQKETILESELVNQDEATGILTFEIKPLKSVEGFKATEAILRVKAKDSSSWNFFDGNETIKDTDLIIDRRPPQTSVISNSYMIKQGGSGILIAEINDENLKDYYVTFNDEVIFELFPFHKKNFYISIITWPIDLIDFKGVKVVAIDMAGNKSSTKVPFYYDRFKEKVDNLSISDDFIYGVSKNVLELSNMDIPTTPQEIFVKANKDLRSKNLTTMRNVVIKNFADSQNMPFDVKTFIRMTNAKTFAMFGERRHYSYKNEKIDEAWHLGMDWASVKRASIVTTNPGKVIFRGYLGIYGESIIIDHGLGLASLYAHTSSQSVDVGDMVSAGQEIGNTGSTGAVFGDHLHFGILVQGIEANPNEWLDANWMKLNLTNTINSAIKIIDGNKR
ncbi:peptidase M24 [Aliarcobacter trophiarum LMG 25534]|uniref:Peptidase M24 n=1 Tax=Aliarcobacter trophiarum LMG 25534 TaxID=1032241 RepID=A0AAD0QLL9_9BACT|nr:M23 family metallopeptidase [Aliarcobacter trophiarum]AXK49583.1 zinc metallopeptidase, M23 family [Aliarcobacter trophiarum LMG 25534]RXI27492.1 peptidase M24 [Aliarcobacter trophiarum]RXJ92259.1 peptidase M24 [Aliarcobacter trophiarum LMG 25534]